MQSKTNELEKKHVLNVFRSRGLFHQFYTLPSFAKRGVSNSARIQVWPNIFSLLSRH